MHARQIRMTEALANGAHDQARPGCGGCAAGTVSCARCRLARRQCLHGTRRPCRGHLSPLRLLHPSIPARIRRVWACPAGRRLCRKAVPEGGSGRERRRGRRPHARCDPCRAIGMSALHQRMGALAGSGGALRTLSVGRAPSSPPGVHGRTSPAPDCSAVSPDPCDTTLHPQDWCCAVG